MKGNLRVMRELTKREQDVAVLVTMGLHNKEIASKLYISEHTVKANLEQIFEKLEIKNRVLLAVYMVKNNPELFTSLV